MVQPCPLLEQLPAYILASVELRFFLGPLVLGVEYQCSHELVALSDEGAWVSSFLRDAESGDMVVEVVAEYRFGGGREGAGGGARGSRL